MTRRELLLSTAAVPLAAANAGKRPSLILFSKHLPKLGYDDLGKACKDFGFDGVDLTVRPKGHVLPENVERDLPRAVEAIRKHGQAVPMITTGLTVPADPAAEPAVAATAATAGCGCPPPSFGVHFHEFRFDRKGGSYARREDPWNHCDLGARRFRRRRRYWPGRFDIRTSTWLPSCGSASTESSTARTYDRSRRAEPGR